jgi:hypothetical protein
MSAGDMTAGFLRKQGDVGFGREAGYTNRIHHTPTT